MYIFLGRIRAYVIAMFVCLASTQVAVIHRNVQVGKGFNLILVKGEIFQDKQRVDMYLRKNRRNMYM